MVQYTQFYGRGPAAPQLPQPPNTLAQLLAHKQQAGTPGYGKTTPQQLQSSMRQGQNIRDMMQRGQQRVTNAPREATPDATTPQIPESVPGDPATPEPMNPVGIEGAAPQSGGEAITSGGIDAAAGQGAADIGGAAAADLGSAGAGAAAGEAAGALAGESAGAMAAEVLPEVVAYVAPAILALAQGGIADYAPHIRQVGNGARGGISWMRRGAKAFTRGLVRSPTPGRADHVRTTVRRGSYVMPADAVSGLGQGNTDAGSAVLRSATRGHGVGDAEEYADGGIADVAEAVPVLLSGGEYVFSPSEVAAIGGGDHDRGSAILDNLVREVRQHTATTLRRLPPPK